MSDFLPPKRHQRLYDPSGWPSYGVRGLLVGGVLATPVATLLVWFTGNPWFLLVIPFFGMVGYATRFGPGPFKKEGVASVLANVLWSGESRAGKSRKSGDNESASN